MQIIADTHIHAHRTLSSLSPSCMSWQGVLCVSLPGVVEITTVFLGVKMAVNPPDVYG